MMSDTKHLDNGRFSVSSKIHDSGLRRRTPRLTSRLLEQHAGQKIHDSGAVDLHTNCVRSISTKKSADLVVSRGTCRQESSPTERNSTLTAVSVDCQHTRRCMERSSVVQAECAKTPMQCMCSQTEDGIARTAAWLVD